MKITMWWSKMLGLAMMPALVHSFAPTDSIQDADPPQSGYLPNHNIDPNSVANSLTMAWSKTYNTNEVFYAKPLVYTPPGAPNEYVITVSNQNAIRVVDGLTGNIINNRTLDAPFASVDTSCGDIPNTVGITGTPIIDSATDTMYFFSKGYKNGRAGPQGTILGQYKFYAVKLPSLTDATGFPVIIDGHYANNDPTRYFVGGTVLNRPGLAMIGNTVVGAFGGHCDNFNYTGMLVAVSKKPGVGVTNIQAMQASPYAPTPQPLDITIQNGGKAGIWQSGMGLAADTTGNRVFFVTGNARGGPGQNGGANGKPASGKVYLSTLEQAAVDMAIDPNTGALTQSDYFEPYGYDSNNGGDRDFGSSGIALLDPTVFYGTGVSRIAIAGGKDGKVYIMNADNLGGFAGGNAGADNVIQTITNSFSLFSGASSYPLEGGYMYLAPSGDSLYAYKFSRDGNGNPQFTLAGKTNVTFAGKSVPTVTSNNGAPGTGIVWLADINRGLQAYNAVPVNGVLTPITLHAGAATGGLTKNQRPVFGDSRVYVVHANTLMSLSGAGQKLKAPLTCAPNPVAFGSVMVDHTSTVQITCTANTAITNPNCSTTSAIFQCANSPLPASVASGSQFTFPVTFNLSDAAILAYQKGGSGQLNPGNQAGTLNLAATANSSYLSNTIIPLFGAAVASGGYLTINQTTISFDGVYIGGAQTSQASRSVTLTNKGSQSLTFTGFAWQDYYSNGMPDNNVTSSTVGNGFTATSFPAVGSNLAAGASITIPLVFLPSQAGISASYLTFWSDGGWTDLLMQGTATQSSASSSSSTYPIGTTSMAFSSAISTTPILSSYISSTPSPIDSSTVPLLSSVSSSYISGTPSPTDSSAVPLFSSVSSSYISSALSSTPLSASLSTSSAVSQASNSSSQSTTTISSASVPTFLSTSTVYTAKSSSTSTSALPYVTPPAPKTRSLTWSIGWVSASPDGYSRPFVGVNGQWPCPAITVNMGDTVKLTVTNNLGNETTAIHFHGLFQRNTTYADGPAMVTQCPIQPGGTFVYQFKVAQPGTYWYHAHIGGQYIDGFRGPLIVDDVNAPYRFDQQYTLTLSDLYHAQAPGLINYYQSVDNANRNNGAEPVPNSILINEAQNVNFTIVPGKRYLFRIINMGAFAPQYLRFDQHDMTVVEIDGVYTQPSTVSQLFVTVAQRYSVIITAKATGMQNFAIKASMSTDMFNQAVVPTAFNTEVSAFLIYNAALPLPAQLTIVPQPFDDSVFTPYDQEPILGPVTMPISMTVSFGTNSNGQYRGFINGIDYVPQTVPTLYTAMNAPANLVNNPTIYGQNANPIVLPLGAVVELTLNNHDSSHHPFHLHGHNFQVVARDPGGPKFPINIPSGPPMRRDTVMMMAGGSVTIRFVADNPGISLFHCHIEWHVEAGLTATFIEAPTQLQALKLYIPVSHRSVCAAQGISMKGNAAGNTKNFLDLTGANTTANTNPWGSLVKPPTTPAPPYP